MGIADARWLDTVDDQEAVLARLDEAFQLARNAPRSAIRYPGHKALVEALSIAPAAVAMRFGVPVFDLMVTWTNTEIPELRDAIVRNIKGSKLAGRHAADIKRVHAALERTTAAPRDPNSVVPGMRGRGKKANKRR